MIRLSPAQYPAAHALYLNHAAYFPLIGAVLGNRQDGVIYADCEEDPNEVYVEHSFGFAQVFGKPLPAFEQALRRYLLIDRAFSAEKVRLYTPHHPEFLHAGDCDGLRSYRQHFQLDTARAGTSGAAQEGPEKSVTLMSIDADNVALMESTFGVVGRFWRTPDDFVRHANAVVAMVEGRPVALCYAAAVADDMAEIDVMTLPSFRHMGLAKATVRQFNERCIAQHVQPLWDCYTNNTASMALCHSAGFVPQGAAYPFFTINR